MMRDAFSSLCDTLRADDSGIRAFIVFDGEDRVFEHYRDDGQPLDLQAINSVTKSVVAILSRFRRSLIMPDKDDLNEPPVLQRKFLAAFYPG
jgi:hypothetical protein